jgi:hypothetical protein
MPIKGSCHCKATQFEVSEPPQSVTQCTCSFCAKRGTLHARYPHAQFRLLTARDRVATYQWHTFTVQHHHCAICGCVTYAEIPDSSSGTPDFTNPTISVNARLFDDFDIGTIPVNTVDGKNLW